ncbi:MAG TPA: hypothetical protein VG146_15115 [Verrucomicrobiae bacterium]|nr:hypothetical protein [Verrucomicrobiae bacterium]
MHIKSYKLRGMAVDHGASKSMDLELEFEDERAFVIWDSFELGSYRLKARIEIDPELLQEGTGGGCDYYYQGPLVLPRPENN